MVGTAAVKIIRLGTPLLVGQLSHYLHQIADSAMLGHYGHQSLELAAIGIAGLLTWILLTFLWPLSTGVQALASRRFGRGDGDTGAVLDNGLVVAGAAGLLALGVSFLAPPALRHLVDSRSVYRLIMEYLRVIRFSLLPMGFFLVCQGFFGAINRTRQVMYAGVISNVLNIALNWVLIFGRLGLPAMGIRGAALGTAISTLGGALYLLFVLLREYRHTYRLFSFRRLSRTLQGDILRVAIPPGVQNVAALSIFLVFQTLVESYGTVYLAATHAVFSYMRLNKTIIGGFARSAAILTGNALGRGDSAEARDVMKSATRVGLAIAVAVLLLTLAGRGAIATLFSNDDATREVIVVALLFFAPFFFVEALGYVREMVLIPNGYGRYVLASEFSTNVLFILGATLVARHVAPQEVRWAWLSFGMYQLVHALLMITGAARDRWMTVRIESTG
ncbi:MAG: MATE family efflux transporter [Spirochaetaceae bacterium]|nr:MAG: MATE family efflux transporter [Spirochaetaceae bacterium]